MQLERQLIFLELKNSIRNTAVFVIGVFLALSDANYFRSKKSICKEFRRTKLSFRTTSSTFLHKTGARMELSVIKPYAAELNFAPPRHTHPYVARKIRNS